MSRILLLVFHPDLKKSKANRALIEAASTIDGVDIVDMGSLYGPSAQLDLDIEVSRLLRAERLILQFPVQWYSTPPLLKVWQDTVLTRMYYFKAETEGNTMRGLPVLVAATAGNDPSAYTSDGINLFPLADLLKPLHSTANRCYWYWSEPFITFRANRLEPGELADAGRRYAERIRTWQSEVRSRSPETPA